MIYFDNAATTMPSVNAVKKAEKFIKDDFYNPSALYRGGLACAKEIKDARDRVLSCLGLNSSRYNVIFTSGGTESDNQAVFCSAKRGSFVTDKGEHAAIYKSFLKLLERKNDVYFIGLNRDGSVNTEELFDFARRNDVGFVSVVHVNNETGAVNDVSYIAAELKKINPSLIFHSDGVQAFGKIPFVFSEDIDLYSVSAHKINALKGCGALIKKRSVRLTPLICGGGQEGDLRSGTENVFGISVFKNAIEERYANLKADYERIKTVNSYVRNGLDKDIFTVISSETASSPYVLSVSAVGLRGEVLMHALEDKGIIVGNGSACSSHNRYSRVLEACGYAKNVLDGVVRISFSHENTLAEAEKFVRTINETARRLKGIIG